MSFSKLLPNSTKKQLKEREDEILYIVLLEWGWDYQKFLETPIPIFMRCWKKHEDLKNKQGNNKK